MPGLLTVQRERKQEKWLKCVLDLLTIISIISWQYYSRELSLSYSFNLFFFIALMICDVNIHVFNVN